MGLAITKGIHHAELTVSKLEESADSFISLLDWKEVRRNKTYPSIFVSDGHVCYAHTLASQRKHTKPIQ